MLDKKALQDKVSANKLTLEGFASELGINYATLYRKLNGISDFTRAEIQAAMRILHLTQAECLSIFFK